MTSNGSRKLNDFIVTSKPDPEVFLITLDRPKALNALSPALVAEVNSALIEAQHDKDVRAVVLTGTDKVFAAGADIKTMKDKTYVQVTTEGFLESWPGFTACKKPIIAAVSGYAFGGGCEVAMMCDIILAAPNAVFGQPEINLGIIPGAGGTQRLTQAIGKSRAMELVLTGRNFTAQEAEQWGLVSRVVGPGDGEVLKEAMKVAKAIASKGALAVQAGKEAVNASFELPLKEGLNTERRLFHGLFATKDQREGMSAFVEKRKPRWSHL